MTTFSKTGTGHPREMAGKGGGAERGTKEEVNLTRFHRGLANGAEQVELD